MAESVTYRGGRVNLVASQLTSYNAQATQRGSQRVAQTIDRMVGFAQQQMADKARVDAVEYGAANAPTAEQINAARESGEELTLPGDNNTLFGRVARQAAATTVTDTIELTARQEINAAVLQAELSRGNPADLQDKLDAIIQGYGGTFDETVPSMSRALKAKLAIVANSKYSSYHSNYIAQARADGKAAWMTNLVNTLTDLDEILLVTTEDQTDPETGVVTPGNVDLDSFVLGKLTEANSRDYTASEIKALETLITAKAVEAASKVLTNGVLSKDNAGIIISALSTSQSKLSTGDDVSLVLGEKENLALSVLRQSGLSDSEIASSLRTERTAQLNFIESEENFKARNADKMIDLYTAQAAEAIAAGDDVKATEALTALKIFDHSKATELEQEWLSRPGVQFSDVIAVETLDALRDNITIDHVIERFALLNQADQEKYLSRARKLDDDDLKLAKTIIKGELNLPDNIESIRDDDPNFENVRIYNRARSKLEVMRDEARQEETDFDPYQASSEILEELGGEFEEAANKVLIKQAKKAAKIVFSEVENRMGSDFNIADRSIASAIEYLRQIKAMPDTKRPNRFKKNEIIDLYLDKLQRAEDL